MATDREQLAKQLLTAFVDELETHVAAVNDQLLALEREGPTSGAEERLHALFRTVHTIKGSSRAAGAVLVEQVTHHLENVLSRLREQRLALSPQLFELLFAVTDAVADSGERLRRGDPERGGSLEALMPRLEAFTRMEGAGPPSPASGAVAAAPPPAPVQGSAESPTAAASTQTTTLRVTPERVDDLIARSSELLTSQGRLRDRYDELSALQQALTLAFRGRPGSVGEQDLPAAEAGRPQRARRQEEARLGEALERILTALREDQRRIGQDVAAVDLAARQLRMVPFADVCVGLERAVRDLGASAGKQISLVVEGEGVQVDRGLLEGLRPSLLHLVRNASDHGLEDAATRAASGKDPVGTVRITATHRGNEIVIVVADDGRGIDVAAVRAQLVRKGLHVPERDEDTLRAIFQPGFSTARLITDLSGRGVGLDVVKRGIEALRGSIDVSSVPGRGVRFSLAVPLTLTSLRGLVVRSRRQRFVVPGTAVQKLLQTSMADVRRLGGVESVSVDGAPVAVIQLADVLGQAARATPAVGKLPTIVVVAEGARLALVVDEVIEERDIYVQSLGSRLRGARSVTGATVLPDGSLALILNVAEVVHRARGLAVGARLTDETARPDARAREILLVDDSLTTRTLERSILEAAGYVVRSAGDGEEALRILDEHGADLVVSDVEMPLMDGFALTAAIRASPRFQGMPVVLLTALGTDADKARGLSAGADAYLVKSGFDQQNLLETIAQLL